MDIIRVDDPSTFPTSIRDVIIEKKSILTPYLDQVKEQSEIGIRCALEFNYMYTDEELSELLDRIKIILEDCSFEGFHNTRVIRKDSLKETGLQLLSPDSYFRLLRSVLSELSVDESEQDRVCSKLDEYLKNKRGNRTERLSFFTPHSLSQYFGKFTKNIGGEVCEFGLPNSFPDVYEKLTSNGYPVTVRFVYPFCDIVDFRKDKIVFEFICHYAAKLILGYNYSIEFDAALIKPVEPHNICEIIDFIDTTNFIDEGV